MKSKIHNVEQRSDEWFDLRADKLTASHAQEIGNNGKGLETYIYKKMAEYFSTADVEYYTNKDMERGNELEDTAIGMYELDNDTDVRRVGFVESDEHVGCSPDGLIGDDGLIEVKCPNDYNFYRVLCNGKSEVKSKYIWQIQMQMLITERDWCDLVYYNPNFEKTMIVFRIEKDDEKQKDLKKGIKKGVKMIKKHLNE